MVYCYSLIKVGKCPEYVLKMEKAGYTFYKNSVHFYGISHIGCKGKEPCND